MEEIPITISKAEIKEEYASYPDEGVRYEGYYKRRGQDGKYYLTRQIKTDQGGSATAISSNTTLAFVDTPPQGKVYYCNKIYIYIASVSALDTGSLLYVRDSSNNLFLMRGINTGFYEINFDIPQKVITQLQVVIQPSTCTINSISLMAYGWLEDAN